MLGRDDHRVHPFGLAVDILDGDLRLGVGAQIANLVALVALLAWVLLLNHLITQASLALTDAPNSVHP